MFKQLILPVAALGAVALAAPANAGGGRTVRHVTVTTTTVVRSAPPQQIYVSRPVYVPQPVYISRPVYVQRPVYVPQPVYVQPMPVYRPVVYETYERSYPSYQPSLSYGTLTTSYGGFGGFGPLGGFYGPRFNMHSYGGYHGGGHMGGGHRGGGDHGGHGGH